MKIKPLAFGLFAIMSANCYANDKPVNTDEVLHLDAKTQQITYSSPLIIMESGKEIEVDYNFYTYCVGFGLTNHFYTNEQFKSKTDEEIKTSLNDLFNAKAYDACKFYQLTEEECEKAYGGNIGLGHDEGKECLENINAELVHPQKFNCEEMKAFCIVALNKYEEIKKQK